MESFETQSWPYNSLYKAVVLFNDVVEVFGLKRLDLMTAGLKFSNVIDRLNPCMVRPALVDGDAIWCRIGFDRALEKALCRLPISAR